MVWSLVRIEPSVSEAPHTKLDLAFATWLQASTYGESVGQRRVWMKIGALRESVARAGLPGLLVLDTIHNSDLRSGETTP